MRTIMNQVNYLPCWSGTWPTILATANHKCSRVQQRLCDDFVHPAFRSPIPSVPRAPRWFSADMSNNTGAKNRNSARLRARGAVLYARTGIGWPFSDGGFLPFADGDPADFLPFADGCCRP